MSARAKKIWLMVGSALVVAYMCFALIYMRATGAESECEEVRICVQDSAKRHFIRADEIAMKLRNEGLYPIGKTAGDVSTQTIENSVDSIPVVHHAECYRTTAGKVCIDCWQREPKLRVIAEENYYVCSDREIMAATYKTAYLVPIVTGRVSREMATGELYDFAIWLEKEPFWNAQIEQIIVTPKREIELIPRIGGHTILLGKLDGYEKKLQKLQVFYTEAFNKIGWIDYREIDLRFRGQVIGRK